MTAANSAPAKWRPVDLLAMSSLQSLVTGYVPWTAWSMRPAAIATVVNEVSLRRRQAVLELGSGTSTVFFARAVADTGGQLVSVEHDPDFARWIREIVDREGLSGHATVACVPLAALPAEPAEPGAPWSAPGQWYDRDQLLAACPETIDMLVVDGPPAGAQAGTLVREPAVPVLWERLAASYSICLDDIDRPAERETARRWARQLGIRLPVVERISLAIGRSDGGFVPSL